MCGIAGYIGKKQVSKSAINKTLGLMKNRGPDNQDWCSLTANDTNVYLLHSRLSIIDLDERSNQPFKFGDCTLIFNGEIYNYIELRTELKKIGHIFTTDSDTEVLIKAYVEYGIDYVKHFNGMWAFAIWDSKKEELFLSRDRFGEKPLYYFHDNDGIYFASEIKFIFSLLGKRLSINNNHLYRNLVNGYKSLNKGGETFFQGIQELSSGSYTIARVASNVESPGIADGSFSSKCGSFFSINNPKSSVHSDDPCDGVSGSPDIPKYNAFNVSGPTFVIFWIKIKPSFPYDKL